MAKSKPALSRRTLFAGAGTVGAFAAVASVMPGVVQEAAQLPAAPKAPPSQGGGYQLTEHVKQYYQTTLI